MAADPTQRADRLRTEAVRRAWESFRRSFPEVETVDLILPDLAGIARGKRLVADAFDGALCGGLGFPSSVYGMDSTGANVAASGLIWERGDADLPCLVDPASLAAVPWRAGGAQVLAGLSDADGGPSFADPRELLCQVASRFADLGLQPVCALELEFYLVGQQPGRDGRARPLRHQDAAAKAHAGQLYGLDALDEQNAFFACLSRYCEAQALPAKSAASAPPRPRPGRSRRLRPSWRSPSRTAPATGCTSM
jgi:glutamine synthetase